MSALLEVSIDLSKIDKSKIIEGKNGAKYISITLSVGDRENDYGQNVSAFHSQTKDQREAKENKKYIGSGKVFWTDGNIEVAGSKKGGSKPQNNQSHNQTKESDDLPF